MWSRSQCAARNFSQLLQPRALGALLIVSAIYEQAPDWDIGISLIMAALANLTAPWTLRVMVEWQWRRWLWMLFLSGFGVNDRYQLRSI